MAVTKTHPIKSTLKAAIDYICNPDKTDGKLLVSAFGCAAETADIEFGWTRRHAIDKGTHLGRHLIQAFEPGEVSPEEAHRIGMELAREVLGGKYEFVLTTHIDKDHVHNHLIFNAVSFTDHMTKVRMMPAMGTITVSERLRIMLKMLLFQAAGVMPTSPAISPTFVFRVSNIPVRFE